MHIFHRYLATVALAAISVQAFASNIVGVHEIDAEFAVSSTPQHADTPAWFAQAVFTPKVRAGTWYARPVAILGGIEGRAREYRRSVAIAGAGLRVRHGDAGWFFEEDMIGTDGRTLAVSGPMEFIETLGLAPIGRRWMVALRHISNANLYEPNRGENMILVGWRLY